MGDFDAKNPPVSVTNPGGVIDREYPRHLHKGIGPTYEYIIVKNDEEKEAALADGWELLPPKPVVPEAKKTVLDRLKHKHKDAD